MAPPAPKWPGRSCAALPGASRAAPRRAKRWLPPAYKPAGQKHTRKHLLRFPPRTGAAGASHWLRAVGAGVAGRARRVLMRPLLAPSCERAEGPRTAPPARRRPGSARCNTPPGRDLHPQTPMLLKHYAWWVILAPEASEAAEIPRLLCDVCTPGSRSSPNPTPGGSIAHPKPPKPEHEAPALEITRRLASFASEDREAPQTLCLVGHFCARGFRSCPNTTPAMLL